MFIDNLGQVFLKQNNLNLICLYLRNSCIYYLICGLWQSRSGKVIDRIVKKFQLHVIMILWNWNQGSVFHLLGGLAAKWQVVIATATTVFNITNNVQKAN